MSRPWLSVIMPTCNGSRYLRQALDSIVRQGDRSIEVLVVDDGSTDDTAGIAESYRAKLTLTVHALPHRGNWVANVNHGMREARGDYLSILHQDDAWCANRLSRLKYLCGEHEGAALIVHPCWYVDSQDRRIGYWRCPFPQAATVIPARKAMQPLLVQCLYGVPAPIFSTAIAHRVGLMDESLWFSADWDFWLKLTPLGNTIYCPTPLAMFRLHPESQTIARGRRGDEVYRQQTLVQNRHISRLDDAALAAEIGRVAQFSLDVNAALLRLLDGRPIDVAWLASRLVLLGPSGWLRYFRDSRVIERCLSRVQAGAIKWRRPSESSCPLARTWEGACQPSTPR